MGKTADRGGQKGKESELALKRGDDLADLYLWHTQRPIHIVDV